MPSPFPANPSDPILILILTPRPKHPSIVLVYWFGGIAGLRALGLFVGIGDRELLHVFFQASATMGDPVVLRRWLWRAAVILGIVGEIKADGSAVVLNVTD